MIHSPKTSPTLTLVFVISMILIGCTKANNQENPLKLTLDHSMQLFNKDKSQQFGLPTVIAFDSKRQCIANASNRDIHGDDFRAHLLDRSNLCPLIDLSEIEKGTSIRIDPNDEITFLVLTESGDYCTACGSILSEFEKTVLDAVKAPYSVFWIDVGMTEWFSTNK